MKALRHALLGVTGLIMISGCDQTARNSPDEFSVAPRNSLSSGNAFSTNLVRPPESALHIPYSAPHARQVLLNQMLGSFHVSQVTCNGVKADISTPEVRSMLFLIDPTFWRLSYGLWEPVEGTCTVNLRGDIALDDQGVRRQTVQGTKTCQNDQGANVDIDLTARVTSEQKVTPSPDGKSFLMAQPYPSANVICDRHSVEVITFERQ